jgi:hypothetical protein
MSILITEKLVRRGPVVESGYETSSASLARPSQLEEVSRSSFEQRRRNPGFASRLKRLTKEYCSLALGAIALELVILFSVSSNDGLFLILPTLAIGTSVYVLDSKKKL